MGSLNITLIHPMIRPVTLLENVSASVFITQSKMAYGNRMIDLNVDIVLNEVKLTLHQNELAHLIRTITGFLAATRRNDLTVPHLEWMKKKMRLQKGTASETGSSASWSEKTSTNSTKISSSAINRFITKTPANADELSDDDLSDNQSDTFSEMGEMVTAPNEAGTRATINIIINEANAMLRNGPYSYLLEILGTHFTMISPEGS
jgi:hypothetical protein